jgi:hypothetical protein
MCSSATMRFLRQDDGRARLKDAENLDASAGMPRGTLTAGLERHLRNAISHGRYTIHSSDQIECEDRDPRTKALT